MSESPLGWYTAVVERVVPQTPRVSSVFLRVPMPTHIAGQHVDVRLTAADGYQAQRSYSIASAPGSELVELAVEQLDDGEVSSYLCGIAHPGDSFELRGPIGGHFIWQPGDRGAVLLIGGGSGVVPLASMVRMHTLANSREPMLLLHSARTWDELVFRDELIATEKISQSFGYVAAITRGRKQRDGDHERRVDASMIHMLMERMTVSPSHVFVCGSNAFVEAATDALARAGIPSQLIKGERFGGAT